MMNDAFVPIPRVSNDGHLDIFGNPGPWLDKIPPASLLLVKHLHFHFSRSYPHNPHLDDVISDFIHQLTSLTHLYISHSQSLRSFPPSISTLSNLHSLEFYHCGMLPSNLELLNIPSFTNLVLHDCYMKSLPHSFLTLSLLSSLHLKSCFFLTELPPSLDHLVSLKHFSLERCDGLKSLPSTMANLFSLETLSVQGCSSLTQLPVNLKVASLKLIDCSIDFIPRGLINLRHFETTVVFCSQRSFTYFKDCINLDRLTLDLPFDTQIPNFSANLNHLVNLTVLCLGSFGIMPHIFDTLESLDKLIILDIEKSWIEYLPWSILNLRKLQFLILPCQFRLQTLPFHLNDSVLICVKGRHIRKSWKQLKHEIGVSDYPIAHGGCPPSIVAPPGFLSLQGDFRKWIRDNYESRLLVRMLELKYPKRFDVSIAELPNLTHLFLTDGCKNICLPQTITGLKHLCLNWWNLASRPFSLAKLFNLETLELNVNTLSTKSILPASLRRLSLDSFDAVSLPACLAKLSNLHTLELLGCLQLTSLPQLNVVSLKINRIAKLLPSGLRQLEILHDKTDCFSKFRDMHCESNMLEHCLTQLVNLELLSLTCYRIKSLPSLARQRNLQVLLLKDCFALKELPPDMDQLLELHRLDLSGTRISSLPDSTIKLSKMQQLTLPRCFTQKLPKNLEKVSIIDDTHKRYYKHMGYDDSDYGTAPDSPYRGDNDDEQSCEGNHVIAQVPGGCSSYNQDVEMHYINENSQRALQNEGIGTMTEKNEQADALCDLSNLACNEETNNPNASENWQHNFSQSHNAKTKTQKLTISLVKIRPLLSSNLKPADSAKQLAVSKFIFSGRKEEFGTWSSNKRRKHDAEEPNVDSPCLEKFPKQFGHGHEKKSLKGGAAAIRTVEESPLESVKESHMQAHEHVEMHLDGANQSNVAQPNGSSSTFDFVKAYYKGDPVWIAFSLTSSYEQLNESICMKFGLEANTFKTKYLDEDKEWSLMTCIFDLLHALLHTSLYGRKFVRLSITDNGVVNRGENLERVIPKKSEGRSTWVSIHFERDEPKYAQSGGENSNEHSTRNFILYPDFCLPCIKPLIEGKIDVKADGNCGFRVIATFEYGDEEKWLDVRIDLLKELNTNKDLYRKALGGEEEFERAKFMVNWLISPAEKMHWFEATCLGLVVATKYQKVFTCWSTEACTYLPLVSRLVDHKPPTMCINMAYVNGNHFIALQMPTNIPLPPLSPLWKRHHCDSVTHWSTSLLKKQLDDYLQLCD